VRGLRPEITDRDLLVLEFLAEHPFAITPHVQVLLGVAAATASDRLSRLRNLGLVDRGQIFHRSPAAARITGPGLAAVGSRLPEPREPNLFTYRHQVGVGWLWLAAHAGTFGPLDAVHTERSMQSHDRRADRDGPPLGVGLGTVGRSGHEQLHYPDLLVTTARGKRVAIELELTGKSDARLDGIMLAFAADRRIDGVVYLVPARERRLVERIERAARRVGVADLVRVQLLDWPPPGVSDHGRMLGHDHGRAPGRAHGRPAREAGR
jgi:hypothetical protein